MERFIDVYIHAPVLESFSMESSNICFLSQLPLTDWEMELYAISLLGSALGRTHVRDYRKEHWAGEDVGL